MMKKGFKTIDEYIDSFPEGVGSVLNQLRQAIQKAAPEASEKISYQIPTFALNGNLVHFAAFKHHIGFYPGSAAIRAFKKELATYEQSKGTVRFPMDKPVPLSLVAKITKYRVKANKERK